MPPLASEWIAMADAPALATWLASATPTVVGMDAATVVDAETIAALAADPRDVLLAANGLSQLWRAPRALAAAALARAVAPAPTAPAGCASGVTSGRAALPEATPWTPPAGALLYPARDAADTRAAAAALFARLGKPADGWLTRRVDRRISRALTRLLVPTGVTPNQVTIASITVGLAAAMLFALGSPTAAIAGSLLFLASTIVDGCDGELARLTFRESRFGARLDVVGDNVVHVFLFGGIAAGVYRRSHDPRIAVAGWLLIVGVILAMATAYASIVRREPTPRQRALFEAFASREFAYLLVALSVADKLEWFLWAAALGTYAFVGGLLFLRR
jgi:phosphatidylglycerophosphate synthase